MQRDFRFKIISEGMKNGVSVTCRKYNISRTLYYRWLKRYKSKGIEGLADMKKMFTPINKTDAKTGEALLNLIKDYPHYGPRALKYLFDELGYDLSESAVYNIMKRNNLTKKELRIKFSKKQEDPTPQSIPAFSDLQSGECWIFWITNYGYFENLGTIYEYTLYDLKSHIACTRLYQEESLRNFEDLLTAVAMPVAQSLHLKINFLYFYEDNKIVNQLGKTFKSKVNKIIRDNGFDFKVHILVTHHEYLEEIDHLKNQYIEGCLSFLMPLIHTNITFTELKIKFQGYVKDYNINIKSIQSNNISYAPVEFHNKHTNTKLILPIWAYTGRQY